MRSLTQPQHNVGPRIRQHSSGYGLRSVVASAKRGRKASVPIAEPETAQTEHEPPAAVAQPEPVAETTVKRRGRPRKSVAPLADLSLNTPWSQGSQIQEQQAEDAASEDETALVANTNRGSSVAERRSRRKSAGKGVQKGDAMMKQVLDATVKVAYDGSKYVDRASLGKGQEHWWSIAVYQGKEKQFKELLETNMRDVPVEVNQSTGNVDPRQMFEVFIPTKKVYTINEVTKKKSSKTVKYKDGGFVYLKGVLTSDNMKVVQATPYFQRWRDVLTWQYPGSDDYTELPQPATAEAMAAVNAWVKEDETQEADALAARDDSIDKQAEHMDVNEAGQAIYKRDYTGSFNNASDWYDSAEITPAPAAEKKKRGRPASVAPAVQQPTSIQTPRAVEEPAPARASTRKRRASSKAPDIDVGLTDQLTFEEPASSTPKRSLTVPETLSGVSSQPSAATATPPPASSAITSTTPTSTQGTPQPVKKQTTDSLLGDLDDLDMLDDSAWLGKDDDFKVGGLGLDDDLGELPSDWVEDFDSLMGIKPQGSRQGTPGQSSSSNMQSKPPAGPSSQKFQSEAGGYLSESEPGSSDFNTRSPRRVGGGLGRGRSSNSFPDDPFAMDDDDFGDMLGDDFFGGLDQDDGPGDQGGYLKPRKGRSGMGGLGFGDDDDFLFDDDDMMGMLGDSFGANPEPSFGTAPPRPAQGGRGAGGDAQRGYSSQPTPAGANTGNFSKQPDNPGYGNPGGGYQPRQQQGFNRGGFQQQQGGRGGGGPGGSGGGSWQQGVRGGGYQQRGGHQQGRGYQQQGNRQGGGYQQQGNRQGQQQGRGGYSQRGGGRGGQY